MRTRTELLARIEACLSRHSMSERHFALRVNGDHKWLARLRRGHVSLQLIERAEAVLDELEQQMPERAPTPAQPVPAGVAL
jgi:hypothetical protein